MSHKEHIPKDNENAVIIGGGIGGLVLALALKVRTPLHPVIYEQATSFDDNAGGAIGLYPNGLRVLRDIDQGLFENVTSNGLDYVYRRWKRHDGTEIACAKEHLLNPDDQELQSLGIRRWRLQKVLLEYVEKFKIRVIFGKRLDSIRLASGSSNAGQAIDLNFVDGLSFQSKLVFGADGIKSKVREYIAGKVDALYTGTTCLMGTNPSPRNERGICFPSSATTNCHGCFYPSGPNEQVFQMYFQQPENPEAWGTLSPVEAEAECQRLIQTLKQDGWADEFIQPLKGAENVIRVGLRARDPLDKWYSKCAVLLGDAAHPPVPYIGQGAMMAIEDAGSLALILSKMCFSQSGEIIYDNLEKAFAFYENHRIPRVGKVLGFSKDLGKMQQERAAATAKENWIDIKSWINRAMREWSIWAQVQIYGTLPVMFEGARYDYKSHLEPLLDEQIIK